MKIIQKTIVIIILGLFAVACQKDEDEPLKIISTKEVVRNGEVIVEASYRNELKKMYFILMSPNTAVVTRATDFDPKLVNRKYYGKEVIPSEFTHYAQTYQVVGIKSYAFNYSDKLKSIVIPQTVTTIGEDAFTGCSILESITCKAKTPPEIRDLFAGYMSQYFQEIRVPQSSVDAYKNALGWSSYADYIVGIEE
ncbi:MAG: leucine-rich repeat protein [Bacteroidales bacterium]|nr:leucine-rich repeat protein [Bacteroidales bacterium]